MNYISFLFKQVSYLNLLVEVKKKAPTMREPYASSSLMREPYASTLTCSGQFITGGGSSFLAGLDVAFGVDLAMLANRIASS